MRILQVITSTNPESGGTIEAVNQLSCGNARRMAMK
jgi:hypothetical protein